jgi:hypothetical protein
LHTSYVADLENGGKRLSDIRRFTLEEDAGARGWTSDNKVLLALNRTGWSLYKQAVDSDTAEAIASSPSGGALLLGATTPDGKWYLGRTWPEGETVEHPTVPFPILRIPLAGGRPETILQLSHHANVSCARLPSNTCVIAEQSEDLKQMIVSVLDPIAGRGPELVRFDLDRKLGVLEVPLCTVSPDGTRLAIARSPKGPIEIRALQGQLMHEIPSPAGGDFIWLYWSADQKGLFVTRRGQPGNELFYTDLQGRATRLRKCIGTETCFGLPSPDGRQLAIIDSNQSSNMWMMENF